MAPLKNDSYISAHMIIWVYELDTRKNSLIQSLFGARGAVATSI